MIIMALVISLCLTACEEEIVPAAEVYPTEYVSFSPYMLTSTKADNAYSHTHGNLGIEIQDWDSVYPTIETKAVPVNTLEGKAGVTVFKYTDWAETESPWDKINNEDFTFDGNTLSGANVKWKDVDKTKMRVFAYVPFMEGLTFGAGTPSFSYTVPADVKNQQDIISAYKEVNVNDSRGQSIALGFGHIMTGIQLKSGFNCTVKSVTISGVYGSGIYSLDGNWSLEGNQNNNEFTIQFEEAKSIEAGGIITDRELTWMMLPQDLRDGAKLTLLCSDDNSYEYSLSGLKWQQGKMITYTLYEKTAESSYIYFDLAAGNVNIAPGENQVTGYVYEKDKAEPVLKTYTHNYGNTYYIYQSTEAKRNDSGNPSGVVDGDNVILPVYPPITYDGKAWADFITNNTSVEEVIEVWDDGINIRGQNAPDEERIGTAVVRDAGRTHTRNYIKVSGQDAKFNLTIDNIYSVIQQPVNSGQAFRLRSVGGIAYIPTGNTELTVNFVGDNRMGCLHINDTPTDKISLQGTGTLTVADADFLTVKDVGDYSSDFGDDKGYISNFWNSAIGNNTDDSTGEKVYNLYINSGVIFAGATKTEDCSAIGGGGNGFGQVYITGGSVTAVATTAGTAIGGGMGHTAKGGNGEVHISGGNVYAYNFANKWRIPSSAIGGGSSYSNVGQNGAVNISGGYVYAYSSIGTAIGGGSSYSKVGGDATITISGGDITAISGAGSGIGGGSACTGGSTTEIHNGGNAVVNISGNPVIRTGSIGGGITKGKTGSKIGSAKINISGGDIQAQFVMAAGAKEVPEFHMSGGVIRDSDVKDTEYKHIQQNGGAVYMEDGQFEMTGGVIRDCSADYGGAVYIKKGGNSANPPSFIMSGGQIYQCMSNYDGGAVYLEDGTVTVSGENTKIESCQSQGSGGAICIRKTGAINPSFSMSGGYLTKNYAASNGGAVHLDGGHVTVSGGSINGNIALDGNGGGISINSGNFDMPAGGTALINANAALIQNQKDNAPAGNGGGVYVTSTGSSVEVKLLSGTITGNSSTNTGGGIGVDVSTANTAASVIVGTDDAGPEVSGNVTLLKGAGLYVNGEKASIVINKGKIVGNSTVGYVDNPDVMNDGGMVTLNGGEVNSVNVIYKGNGGDSIDGEEVGKVEHIQRIVTDTNNKLIAPTFYRNGYKFVRWNTRADGLGVDNYSDGQTVKRSSDLILYAIWELN